MAYINENISNIAKNFIVGITILSKVKKSFESLVTNRKYNKNLNHVIINTPIIIKSTIYLYSSLSIISGLRW